MFHPGWSSIFLASNHLEYYQFFFYSVAAKTERKLDTVTMRFKCDRICVWYDIPLSTTNVPKIRTNYAIAEQVDYASKIFILELVGKIK